MKHAPIILAAVLLLTAGSASISSATQYRIVDLGTLGGPTSQAFDINESGQVVGMSTTADGTRHGFLWDIVHGMQDLGPLMGPNSTADAINDNGLVIGNAVLAGNRHGIRLDTNAGIPTGIDPLPGDIYSWPRDINNLGQVAGLSGTSTYVSDALVWNPDGGIHDFGPGWASGINENGDVVGYLYEQYGVDKVERGFFWSPLSGMHSLDWGTRASAVNDRGQVVGWSGMDNDGFIWDSVQGFRLLDGFGPGDFGGSSATDINNLGQVVGSGQRPDSGENHAFVWDSINGTLDLGTLPGYAHSHASGINEFGLIAGRSELTLNGDSHAVLWVPVPEPSGLAALAGGTGMLGILLRRRR